MSIPWLTQPWLGQAWLDQLLQACWQGGLAVAAVWVICRMMSWMPGRIKCWLWRLATARFLIALAGITLVELHVLPPTSSPPPPMEQAPTPNLASLPPGDLAIAPMADSSAPETQRPTTDWTFITTRLLLSAWLIGTAWSWAILAWQWRQLRRLRRAARPIDPANPAEAAWGEVCRQLLQQLSLWRKPQVLFHPNLASPMVMGWLRPVILIPAHLANGCSPATQRMILAHELGHLRRWDLQWSWLPAAVRATFFFHPLAWLAERQCRLAQELACDQLTMKQAHVRPATYGRMLMAIVELAQRSQMKQPAALNAAGSFRGLRERMLAMSRFGTTTTPSRLAISAAVLTMLAMPLLVPWRLAEAQGAGQPVGAGEASEKKQAKESSTVVETRKTESRVQSETKSKSSTGSTVVAGGGGAVAGGGAGGAVAGGAGGEADRVRPNADPFAADGAGPVAEKQATRMVREQILRIKKENPDNAEMQKILDDILRQLDNQDAAGNNIPRNARQPRDGNAAGRGGGMGGGGMGGGGMGGGGGGRAFGGSSSGFSRSASFSENGTEIQITESNLDGIRIVVSEQVNGRQQKSEYRAKDATELRRNEPKAYAIYQKYIENNPRMKARAPRDGAGGDDKAKQAW